MNVCTYVRYGAAMPHPLEHSAHDRPLSEHEAEALAASMRAFGTASRLRLLWALLDGDRTVEELEAATGLAQSLVSHQLRILRNLRFVAVRREGRRAHYRLASHHVPEMLAAIRHHQEHAAVGEAAIARDRASEAPAR